MDSPRGGGSASSGKHVESGGGGSGSCGKLFGSLNACNGGCLNLAWHRSCQWLPWWLPLVGGNVCLLAGLDDSESYFIFGHTTSTCQWNLGGSAAQQCSLLGIAYLTWFGVNRSLWSEGTVGEGLLTSGADVTSFWFSGFVRGEEFLDGIKIRCSLLKILLQCGLVISECLCSACLQLCVIIVLRTQYIFGVCCWQEVSIEYQFLCIHNCLETSGSFINRLVEVLGEGGLGSCDRGL